MKKQIIIKIFTFLLCLSFIITTPTYAAFDQTIETAEKLGNTALDYVDSAINLSQVRRLKQEAWDRYGLILRPYYKTSMEYTSNVFREPSPTRDDVIWHFTPGISGIYLNDIAKVGVAYEADFKVFTKFGNPNDDTDQSFGATIDLYPMENLYVKASEQLNQVGVRGGTVKLEPINYLDNTVAVTAGYKWKRWTPEITYANFRRGFRQALNDKYDYTLNTLQFRLHEDIVKDIRTFIGYDLGLIRYWNDATKAADTHTFLVGIRGTMVWDVIVNANIGYYRRHQFNDARKNHNTIVTTVSFIKNFNNNKTVVEMGYTRRPVEVAFENRTFYYEDYFYTGIKHKLTKKLRLRTALNVGKRTYVGTSRLGLEVAERTDDFIGVNVGADLALRKWLVVHLDYDYNHRQSNFDEFPYSENQVKVGLTMPF